jgi:hypothetical protein
MSCTVDALLLGILTSSWSARMMTISVAIPDTSRWFKQVEESKTSFHAHETAACLEQIGLPHKFIIQEPETSLQRIGKKYPRLGVLTATKFTVEMHHAR